MGYSSFKEGFNGVICQNREQIPITLGEGRVRVLDESREAVATGSNGFAQKLPRLCRLMCGRPLAFRQDCPRFGLRPICWAKPQIHCEPERKRRALPHIRRQSRWRESLFRQSRIK